MEKTERPTIVFIDPVCGVEVVPGRTRLVANYRGHSYWFCDEDCRHAFHMDPLKYLRTKTCRKGLLGRYLDRLKRGRHEPLPESR